MLSGGPCQFQPTSTLSAVGTLRGQIAAAIDAISGNLCSVVRVRVYLFLCLHVCSEAPLSLSWTQEAAQAFIAVAEV